MMASGKERLFAALIPLVFLLVYLLLPYYAILVPLTAYFIAKEFSSSFVADYALKFFDLLITLLIVLFLAGLTEFALDIVARDGHFSVLFLSENSLTMITTLLVQLYGYVGVVVFMIFPMFGSKLQIPLSLRIFQTLRGNTADIARLRNQKTHG